MMRSVCCQWVSLVWTGALIVLMTGVTQAAHGQAAQGTSIVERYQAERLRHLSAKWLNQTRPLLSPKPLIRLTATTDSLRPAPEVPSPTPTEKAPAFTIDSRETVRRLARPGFSKRFRDTQWAFLGAGYYLTPFDTTKTLALRARLQAQFGAPTQTVADFSAEERPEETPQFAYWFVVNDSIPVRVTDAGGPYDRGLILAADARYRDDLHNLRRALLAPLLADSAKLAPYVDYYHDSAEGAWYRAGFDGRAFFVEPIRAQEVTPGRRPWMPEPPPDRRARPSQE